MVFIIAAAFIAVVIGTSEAMRVRKVVSSEATRKFIHIIVGVFVASWPFYMTRAQIIIFSAILLAVVLASRVLHVLASIHSVKRKTWGDILFPVGIAVAAFLMQSPWIFAAAILHLGFADGMAALIGTAYGRQNRVKFLSTQKSFAGMTAFFICSLIIFLGLSLVTASDFSGLSFEVVIGLAATATMVEAACVYGIDNVLLPLVISVLLGWVVA